MFYQILHIYINTTTTAYSHTSCMITALIISLKSIYENWYKQIVFPHLWSVWPCWTAQEKTDPVWAEQAEGGGRRQERNQAGETQTLSSRAPAQRKAYYGLESTQCNLHCWGAKMKLKTVSILLAACYVKINSCENSLEEYLGPDSKSGDLR